MVKDSLPAITGIWGKSFAGSAWRENELLPLWIVTRSASSTVIVTTFSGVSIGRMGQGVLQKGDILETVANGGFQIFDHTSSLGARVFRLCSNWAVKSWLAAAIACRMPLQKASSSELPWALMTGLRMPKNWVPPTSR